MTGKRRIKRATKKFSKKKADEQLVISGILGLTINGVQRVDVHNREGYVHVRLRDNLSEVIQAYNSAVSPIYGLPVLVTRSPSDRSKYIILGRDLGRYQNWGTSPFLPRHGNQHSFNPDNDGGGDIVWVFGPQFMPLNAVPSGSAGAGSLLVYPYTYYYGAAWHYFPLTSTADLLVYKPTGTSSAKMVLLYLDQASTTLGYSAGNEYASSSTGTANALANLPAAPTSIDIPIAGVRLVTGTSIITWSNLYDVRPYFNGAGGGAGGAGLNAVVFQDDNVYKISGSVVSFDSNLTVSVVGNVAHINATGGGSGGTGSFDVPLQNVAFGGDAGNLISDVNYFYYETGTSTGQSRLLIGDSSLPYISSSMLGLVRDGGSVGINIHSYGGIPLNSAFASRGTKASPGVLLLDDNIGWWSFGGYDGASWVGAKAIIKGRTAEDWSASARGTYWEILATQTGTNSTTTGMRIEPYRTILAGDLIVSGSVFANNISGGGGGTGTSTYMLAGVPISATGLPTSTYWTVPGGSLATGTLSVFVNGVSQLLGVDYQVQYAQSGTYQLLDTPPTGSVHFAIWGIAVGGGSTTTNTIITASEILAVQVFS